MKEKTKKIIYRKVVFRLVGVATLLVLAACAAVTGPDVSDPLAGKGVVNISLGTNRLSPLKTILPGSVTASAFDKYDLAFTVVTGESGTTQSFTDVTSLTATLDPGKYDLVLTAKKGSTTVATGESKGITVTEGAETPISVPLVFKAGAGNGTLSFSITRPSGLDLSDAQFALTPLHSGGTTYGKDWLKILYEGEKKESHSSDETITSGYYQATVTLSTGERKAVKSGIVHIGAGQKTTLSWTFAAGDFATIVENIWVVGAMNTWTLPGTKMTAEADGTFSWEGEITGTDPAFKFSLTDTTGWTDTWNGNWFAPSITETSNTRVDANVGTGISMVFAPTNTNAGATSATESAWKMNAGGYYKLIVNPYTKTFDIEAPPAVTGVAITGGNITLNKGATHDFTATVSGHNSPSQDVTWSITTSSLAAGTAFGGANGNTLAIDAAETAPTLTIRATSTADSTEYGEVTVTVQAPLSPVVTSVTVSAAGGATEVTRSGTLQFNANVQVSNGATQAVTWTVSGKDKDGNATTLDAGTSIDTTGLLTVAAAETAVDLVVRATSQQSGFTDVYGEATVFVKKLGQIFLIGDEFGNWTDTGTVEMDYTARGVYTKTVFMSKTKSFRFKDNSSNVNHFEPYPDGQEPSGTVDAWQHQPTQSIAWKTTQGGRYVISLDTVTQKVTFTVTKQVITITDGPSALAPGENGTFTYTTAISETDAPVTWNVYGDGVDGHAPQSGTKISNGTLTLGSSEWVGHKLYVTVTSLGETVESTDNPVLGVPVIDANVYIVGFMNSGGNWDNNGDLMTRGATNDTKHLFTWTGALSGNNDFRMHYGGSGNDNGWVRLWFVPEGKTESDTTYGINNGWHADMPVDRWTTEGKTDMKWQISSWGGSGNYTIVFNAATRKLDVTH